MAKFAVQGRAAEAIYVSMGSSPDKLSSAQNVQISLLSGVIAGVAAAIISHPADTLLSKVNKPGAKEFGNSVGERLVNIAKSIGFAKLATQGLGARCVMVRFRRVGAWSWSRLRLRGRRCSSQRGN